MSIYEQQVIRLAKQMLVLDPTLWQLERNDWYEVVYGAVMKSGIKHSQDRNGGVPTQHGVNLIVQYLRETLLS